MSTKLKLKNYSKSVFNYESPKEIHKELQQSHEYQSENIENQQEKFKPSLLANKTTKSSKTIFSKTNNVNKPINQHYVTKHLKQEAYNQTLTHTRIKLSKSDKTFSQIVHQRNVEFISDIAAYTVADPGAILGGGIFVFFGGVVIIYISKHIGFEVPSSIFILLFITGFTIGFIVSRLAYKFKHKNKQIKKLDPF